MAPSNTAERIADLEQRLRSEGTRCSRLQEALCAADASAWILGDSLGGGLVAVASDGSFIRANPVAQERMHLVYDMAQECYVLPPELQVFCLPAADEPSHSRKDHPAPFKPLQASELTVTLWTEVSPLLPCLATGKAQPPVTLGMRQADGEVAWFVFTTTPRWDADGLPCGAWMTLREVGSPVSVDSTVRLGGQFSSEANVNEVAPPFPLHQPPSILPAVTRSVTIEEQLRFQTQLLDSVREALIATDMEGHILYWTRGAECLYGYEEAEVRGRHVTLIVPPDAQEEHLVCNRHLLEGGFWEGEFLQQRKDGSRFWADMMIGPLQNTHGEACGLVGVCRDVTLRRSAEIALRTSQRRLEQVMEHLPAGAVFVEGERIRINGAAEQITGYGRDELMTLGDWFAQLFPETAAQMRVNYDRCRERGLVGGAELLIRQKGGAWRQVDFTGYRDGLEEVWLLHDVTERKQAEELLRRREAELAHVTRLSTLGEMAAEIAHEVNQPLYAITNFASACAQVLETHSDPTIRSVVDWVGRMREQAERAGEIIRRLRKFVDGRPQQPVRLNVKEAVHESLQLLGMEIRRHGIRVELEGGHDYPDALADPIQVQQVLVNLIRNACEAMVDSSPGRRRLAIQISRQEIFVQVSVRDTGPGIGPERLERLFDAFFTTKPNGMGMGLPISRTIIDAHGGRLWASPDPRGGMVFSFTLPTMEGINGRNQ